MKRSDFLFLLISSVILVVAWIIFNVIHQSVTSTITETVASDIAPIPATFDTKTIDAIKNRTNIVPIYSFGTSTATIAAIPTTIPTPTLSFAQTIGTGSSQTATAGGTTQ